MHPMEKKGLGNLKRFEHSGCRGLKLIPAKNLHVSTPTWWLESRFHFRCVLFYFGANISVLSFLV